MKGIDPDAFLKVLAANGLQFTVAGQPERPRRRAGKGAKPARPQLVAAAFVAPNVWLLPVVTRSEINLRDFRKRSNRTQEARRVVSRELAPRIDYLAPFVRHYHAGKPLGVTLTRLAPTRLDLSNLPTATKATEDAVAFQLGADDGDPRWRVVFAQEVQPLMGVRLTLEVL